MNDPLSVPAPDLDIDALHTSLGRSWGLAGELTAVHGERDRNFRLDGAEGRYLLKVHNPADVDGVVDLQCSALRHLRAVAPDLPVPAVVPTQDGRSWLELTGRDGRKSLAWVMTWLDGRHPEPQMLTPPQLGDWGRTAARLGRALRGFVHPAACYPIAWDIRRLPELRPWLRAVGAERRPLLEAVLDRFEGRVCPELHKLRAQVVHNDLAPGNVLVDDTMRVVGITDFGDMTHTSLVCDLAVATADVLSGREGGLDLAPWVIAGYDSITPLEPGELSLIADLMAARYAAAVLITAWRTRQQGWAPEIDDEAYRRLEAMLDIGLDALAARLSTATVTGSPGAKHGGRGLPYIRRSTEGLLRARALSLGGLELSYARPLHIVGGRGVFLEAADGRRYLDAYNNVPVLGHSHPAVVDAVCSQLATLNTNSRYLQEAPVELAERLLTTLPDSVRSGAAGELGQRSKRPGLADRAACHRRLRWHRHQVGLPRCHRSYLRVLTRELGERGPPRSHSAGGAATRAAVRGRRGDREPRGRGTRRGSDAGRRGVHERRDPRTRARLDGGRCRRGPRRGRFIRRRRGAGGSRPYRRCFVELPGRGHARRPGDPRQADGQRLPGRRGHRSLATGGPVRARH